MSRLPDKQFFDDVFAKEGGRLDTRRVPHIYLTRVLDYHLDRARDTVSLLKNRYPSMPHIYVDYLANQAIKAYAMEDTYQNRGLISISGGAVCLFFFVFRRMLADPRIMPDTGNPSMEDASLPTLPQEPVRMTNVYTYTNAMADIGAEPHDSDRGCVAANLIEIGFDFLIDHEYSHIALGHTFFYRELGQVPYISEFGWDEADGLDNLTKQAMEYAGDYSASDAGLSKTLYRLDHPELVNEPFRFLYTNAEEALYRWFFAVFASYRMFGRRSFDLDNLESSSHPHYRIRQRAVCYFALDYFEEHRPELAPLVMSIAERTLEDVERAYAQITATDPQSSEIKVAFEDPRVNVHVRKLIARGKEIEVNLINATGHRLKP